MKLVTSAENEKKEVAENYRQKEIPRVVGAIDGSHHKLEKVNNRFIYH